MSFLAVAAGGAFGACLRAAIMGLVAITIGRYFSHGLAVVNTLGSFLLGAFVGLADPSLHPFLLSGLCGALTTYSTFAHSAVELLRQGRIGAWFAHNVLNLGGSLAGVSFGLALAYQ